MNLQLQFINMNPDSKVHESNMGPTWVLLAPDGPHDDPMNLAIREAALASSLPLGQMSLIHL